MEGVARAATQQHENALKVAHHQAAWSGAASVGKLKPFKSYVKQKDDGRQTGGQMLGALRMLQDMGAPITIRQMN